MLSMSRRVLYMVLGGIIALAAVAALAVGGATVFAQSDAGTDTTPLPAQGNMAPRRGFGDRQNQRGDRGPHRVIAEQRGVYLAEALGISVEELETAQEAVRLAQQETFLDQAVADGLLTQEEADAMLSGESSFRYLGRQLLGMKRNGRFNETVHNELLAAELGITITELEAAKITAREAAQAQALADGVITPEQVDMMAARQVLREFIDQDAILADVLGVTAAEVSAAKEDGVLRDLIEASGLTLEEMGAARQTAHEEAVAAAVAAGIITQEQADQLQSFPGRDGIGGPCGGGGGRGRGGGPRGNGSPGGPQNNSAPAVPGAANSSDA